MRGCILVVCALGLTAPAQQTTPAPLSSSTNAPTASQPADPLANLTAAWQQQHDPKLRQEAARALVDAAIYDRTGADNTAVVENVARDNQPAQVIDAPPAQKLILHPILDLGFLNDTTSQDGTPRPVFRRIAADRFEVWIPNEGWLFDEKGRLLAHVAVPRRDGKGREWYGAFLPDGTWVTTDLWKHDKELNCFDPHGKWKWTLKGDKMEGRPSEIGADAEIPQVNTFNWARATRDGRHWLVSVGEDLNADTKLVDRHGKFVPPPESAGLWQLVYPRAMGPRGVYNHVYINSDDNKVGLHRDEPAHGPECGWSTYDFPDNLEEIRLSAENNNLGFWPRSHDVFVVDGQDGGTQKTWFFDGSSRYQAEMDGTYFADAANGRDLLILNPESQLIQVAHTSGKIEVKGARQFNWPDDTVAEPAAVYDDLHVGFFSRGNGISLATW